MRILVVGDGPRDQHALPNLVRAILKSDVEARYDDWHRVTYLRGKGSIYARKVKYLARRARVDGFSALAIVTDTDKSLARDKLRQLRAGRDEDRQTNPPFPTALGEANPHFDVWLLDDAVAVRNGLRLPSETPIPNSAKSSDPKNDLNLLIAGSPRESDDFALVLGDIASHLKVDRCPHRKENGLATFESDVHDEIRPALGSSVAR